MDRTPGASVRRELRQEVGFGCPVDGCGSPYLTWHHFDPPWREREHEDVEGIIALCPQHHNEADVGAFSPDQLRALKADPFMKRTDGRIAGHFNWKRQQVILQAGGGLYIRCPVFLLVQERRVVWFSLDENENLALNLDLCDKDGNLVFSMRDNDWIVLDKLDDVEAKPSTDSLSLRAASRGIRLSLDFKAMTLDDIRTHPSTRRAADIIEDDWPGQDFVICTLSGEIPFPYPIRITPSGVRFPGGGGIGSNAVMADCYAAIAVH
jgi:hypothetical protein